MRRLVLWFTVLTVFAGAGVFAQSGVKVTMQAVGTFDSTSPSGTIEIKCCADETEPASFVVNANKDLNKAIVKLVGNLVSSTKSEIPAVSAEIRIVDGEKLVAFKEVDFKAGRNVRFWLTLRVPPRTPAGTYTGYAAVFASGKPLARLPIKVTILPMRLLLPSKQYGYSLRSDGADEETYKSLLARLPSYGITLTSISGPIESIPKGIKNVRDAKLGTTIVYYNPGLTYDEIIKAYRTASSAGVARLFYVNDYESNDESLLDNTREMMRIMKLRLERTMAVINNQSVYEKLGPVSECTALHISLPYVQDLLAGKPRVQNRKDWWYWDITSSPKENRLYAGLLLWKAGLDGVFIPHLPASGGSDEIGEPIFDSLLGEAFREGTDDIRYLTTMMNALREVKDGIKAGKFKNPIPAQMLAEETERYLASCMAKPLMSLKHADYQNMRFKFADYAMRLRAIAPKY